MTVQSSVTYTVDGVHIKVWCDVPDLWRPLSGAPLERPIWKSQGEWLADVASAVKDVQAEAMATGIGVGEWEWRCEDGRSIIAEGYWGGECRARRPVG